MPCTTLTVKPISKYTVAVKVVDQDGFPAGGATVWFDTNVKITRHNGIAEYPDVERGRYKVFAVKTGYYSSHIKTIEVTRDMEVTLTIRR